MNIQGGSNMTGTDLCVNLATSVPVIFEPPYTNLHLITCLVGGTVHKHITFGFISVINQLDAQNFCFTISLFHASTCFEHMCSKHVEA